MAKFKGEQTSASVGPVIIGDEFEQDGRLSSQWSYEHGYIRNNEAQWYQEDNATVHDGVLDIEGRKGKEHPYTSSSVTTQRSFNFLFGRMEVRAKIPVVSGAWPAIWTLGVKGEWPQNGEIDIMEFYRPKSTPSILANACWGGTKRWSAVWDSEVIPLSHFIEKDVDWKDKFHVWRMDWDSIAIKIYLDDELLNVIELDQTFNQRYGGNCDNPFRTQPAYILLNLAMGAQGGEIDESALPMHYLVDYVRVYKKN